LRSRSCRSVPGGSFSASARKRSASWVRPSGKEAATTASSPQHRVK
jgi:hypothetical protein